MKKIIAIIIACLLYAVTAKLNAQQVGLTIVPQSGPTYTAGTTFQVYANYNYSNVSGNIQVTVSYDPNVLSFCGSPSFPATAVAAVINPTTSTITYTFPATVGNNQTGVIMMCFSYICPQTCTGTPVSSTIGGNITALSSSLSSNAASVTVNGVVNNTWTGQHTFFSFIQSTYEITFKITVYGSACFRVNNPYFVINPSVGTLVSATNATINGNIITPIAPFLSPGTHTFYYTLKLPCNTLGGTVVSSPAVFYGDNCGNNSIIDTLPVVSYTLPATVASNPNASFNVTASAGYYQLSVGNNGNTPLNLVINNTLPQVKTNSVQFTSSSQLTGLSANVIYSDCAGVPSVAHPLMAGSSNTTPPSYATKADISVTNLLPGNSLMFRIYYDLTNSCSGVPNQQQYPLYAAMTYECSTAGLSICYGCGIGGGNTLLDTAVFAITPNIRCVSQPAPAGCRKPGDTLNVCLRFENNGQVDLLNGVLQYNLPSFVTFLTGSETFTGFSTAPVYQTGTSIKWNLPTIPAAAGTYYDICFKAIVNANAPYGNHNMSYAVSGSNHSSQNPGCPYAVNICALPAAFVEKRVKGNLDAAFGTSGNGHPGSIANYEITVHNTGNTPIGNMVLVDRMPFPGDVTIMSCIPRNSQFSLFPAAALSIPGATVTYSNTGNIATGWPTAPTACAVTGSFAPAFQPNSIRIALTNPIPAGGNYTFTFPVSVPGNAVPGQTACNSIGLVCDLINNSGNSSQMNPVESNLVCLTVQEREEPPVPCTPCKDMLRSLSLSAGSLQESDTSRIQQGVLTLATSKPLQELRISLADLSYNWENKGCADCNMPLTGRGCLYPQQSNQTVGGLIWDNYSNTALPPNVSSNQCMEELVWKLGSQATAGTYSIPLQLSLPLPTVNACCRLNIKSICLRVILKDKDCNTCDTIICIRPANPTDSSADCCKESRWTSNMISSGVITGTTPSTGHNAGVAKSADSEKITTAIGNVIQAKCGETYSLIVNTAYNFFAAFQCAQSTCPPRVELHITGPGLSVTQSLSNASYPLTFTQTGTYQVTYIGYCGNKVCATCRYTVQVRRKIVGPSSPIPSTHSKNKSSE